MDDECECKCRPRRSAYVPSLIIERTALDDVFFNNLDNLKSDARIKEKAKV